MKTLQFMAAFTAIFLAGCGGPNLSPVSGTVTLDGEPLENAIVAFVPDAGGTSATGTTDATGAYKLVSVLGAGLEPGTYRVSISMVPPVENGGSETSEAAASSDSAAYEAMASGGGAAQYKAAEALKKKLEIPAKYNSASTLQKDVTAGDNEIDFNLSSKD
jgi:hypothetical protein